LAVSATVLEILTHKARKSLNFSDRPLFEAPFGGHHLEFGDEIWRQKTRVSGLLDGEEIMPLAYNHRASFLRFDTIPARDRQTDTLLCLLPALA